MHELKKWAEYWGKWPGGFPPLLNSHVTWEEAGEKVRLGVRRADRESCVSGEWVGRSHALGQGLRADPIPWGSRATASHPQGFRGLGNSSFSCRTQHRDQGNAAVRHKCISAPSTHRKHTTPLGTAKPGKLFNKICQDHYFWEEIIWLGLSWLLGTQLEYTLENAELCHLCIPAYGAKISNLILAINTVWFCFPE